MPFDSIIDDLVKQGWSLQQNSLPESLIQELITESYRRAAQGLLTPAGVGRAQELTVRDTIRGDSIHWLEHGQATCTDAYLEHMEALRVTLNQAFFLGLEDFECHMALYPPGSFYKTHVDRFRDDDSRTVTAVTYLNSNWTSEDGGLMRLYLSDGAAQDIPPLAGNLAVFMSADRPHEVLPTQRERLALTGWFKRRSCNPLPL
ncbi:SM-20-related protein [Azomonas agilis]|uniref:SM-20-related protein n=1 Tax=Azomonas agilis TaxID=116849 RepID=A0A562IZ45_9GAMM|nr:2OG-Fe(II) oxygenase [Azomonas agilis]TWH76198.1 SM-20-related protein [Azomonas agilis]